MADTELSTYYWRDHAKRRYTDIRQVQASKLLPIQRFLAERNFEKLEGSLISAEQLHNPAGDSPVYLQKRLNYVMLLDQLQCQYMMEIGFNWGYSASLLLESSPASSLHSVDIGWHWYTPPTGDLLAAIYPGRFRYTWQDSREALLTEVAAGNRYDMISVDGGHDYSIARSDIMLSVELLREGGLLMVDDTDGPSVAAAVLATVAGHPDMIELTAANFGLFDFGKSEQPCFEQRYFLKRAQFKLGYTAAVADTGVGKLAGVPPAVIEHAVAEPARPPAAPPSVLRRAVNKFRRMSGL